LGIGDVIEGGGGLFPEIAGSVKESEAAGWRFRDRCEALCGAG